MKKLLMLLLGLLWRAQAEFYDVTTIYRLGDKQNGGSKFPANTTNGMLQFEGCVEGSPKGSSCIWTVDTDEWTRTDSSFYGGIFPKTVVEEYTSWDNETVPRKSLTSEVFGVSFKPTRYEDVFFVFSTEEKDSIFEDSESHLVVLRFKKAVQQHLYAQGHLLTYEAYRCIQGQEGAELQISKEFSRRCDLISSKLKQVLADMPVIPTFQHYRVNWSPSELKVISTLDQSTVFNIDNVVQMKFMKTMMVFIDGQVKYTKPSPVMSLSSSKATIYSSNFQDIKDQLLCLTLSAYLDPRSGASLTLSINNDNIGRTQIGIITAAKNSTSSTLTGRSTYTEGVAETWKFVTFLHGYSSTSFSLLIEADRLADYPVLISDIASCTDTEIPNSNLSTQVATEIHARTNARGLPFLVNNQYMDPTTAVDVPSCNAYDSKCGWKRENFISITDINIRNLPLQQEPHTNWTSKTSSTKEVVFDEVIYFTLTSDFNQFNSYFQYQQYSQISVFLLDKKADIISGNMYAIKFDQSYVSILKCSKHPVNNQQSHFELGIVTRYCEPPEYIKLDGSTRSTLLSVRVDEGKISVFSNRELLVQWTDPTPIEVAYYSFGTTHENPLDYTIYYPSYFSLNKESGTFVSPPLTPSSTKLCVALEYFMNDTSSTLEVVALGSSDDVIGIGEPENIHTLKNNHADEDDCTDDLLFQPADVNKWRRAIYVIEVADNYLSDQLRVMVRVNKTSDSSVWIQRLAGCSAEDAEDILVLSSGSSSAIEAPGYNTVATDRTKHLSDVACNNGGRRDSQSKECICPAGFSGKHCEIGCGANSYGDDCGGSCSATDRQCRGMILCRPLLGCACAPGLRGPLCDTPCSPGTYGVSCKQKCGECASGTCDIYTGKCLEGCDSESGLYPPMCQDKYAYLTSPPVTSFNKSDVLAVSFDLRSRKGKGKPLYYQIQMRNAFKEDPTKIIRASQVIFRTKKAGVIPPELKGGHQSQTGKDYTVRDTVSGTNPGIQYQVRVVLVDEDGGSYQGDDIPITDTKTSCTVSTSADYRLKAESITANGFQLSWKYSPGGASFCPAVKYEIHLKLGWRWVVKEHAADTDDVTRDMTPVAVEEHLLPGKQYQVKVRAVTVAGPAEFSHTLVVNTLPATEHGPVEDLAVTSHGLDGTSVDISWKPPRNAFEPNNINYKLTYKCLELLACSNEDCSASTGEMQVKRTSASLKDLLPFARYSFTVTSGTLGHPATVHTATTTAPPSVAPSSIAEPIFDRSNSSFSVGWAAPNNCSGMNGFLIGYHYELIHPNQSAPRVAEDTVDTVATFTDLEPHTHYSVQVYAKTFSGWNRNFPLTIPAKTRATTPDVVQHLTVYKRGRRMLGLRWSKPRQTYGPLRSFTVTHQSKDGGAVSETVMAQHCAVWPEQYCHTIRNLTPDQEYVIQIQARNSEVDEDGDAASVTGVTKEGAPGAPTDLKLVNLTSTSVTVEWGLPDLINGQLRSFLFNIEETDSANTTDCCQTFPMKEVLVKSEQRRYKFELTELRASSTYLISVTGKTVALGPSVSITANTRPPTPTFVTPLKWLNPADLSFDNEMSVVMGRVDSYNDMISGYMLLLATNEESGPVLDIHDTWLLSEVSAINQTMYLVADFTQTELDLMSVKSDVIKVLPSEEVKRSHFGTTSQLKLPTSDISYQLVQVAVLDYCGSKSIAFIRDSVSINDVDNF